MYNAFCTPYAALVFIKVRRLRLSPQKRRAPYRNVGQYESPCLSIIHWIILVIMLSTATELPEYIRRANELLSEAERKSVIDYLAAHPRAGNIMEGTGGIRKLRWARGSKGKSGGVRVIYYYHDQRIPLYLLTVFGKNEKSNITKSERNELANLVDLLVQIALEREHV